jgi:hypothetical protein
MTSAHHPVDDVLSVALSTLNAEGYAIVPDALDESALSALNGAVDDIWYKHLEHEGPVSFLHLFGFQGLHPQFLELVAHPPIIAIVRAALTANVYVYHSHLDVHPPLSDPAAFRFSWHRDGGRINDDLGVWPQPRLSVKVAYFLSDVLEPDRGNLHVIPRSHLSMDAVPPDGAIAPESAVPVLAPAGSAVLFDRRLIHSRGPNTSHTTRRALFLAYAHRWLRPRDVPTLPPGTVEGLSSLQRQLLGLGDDLRAFHVPGPLDLPLAAPQQGREGSAGEGSG